MVETDQVQIGVMEVDEVKPAMVAEQTAGKADVYDFLVLVSLYKTYNFKLNISV